MTDLRKMDYPVTKGTQAAWADSIKRTLLDGEVNPFEFITKVKGLQTALSAVEKDKAVKETVMGEIAKYGKSATWNGATLTVKETGVKYDYSMCGDPVYSDLIGRRNELEALIKERESFLKTVPDGTTIVDDTTGEVVTLHPAVRMATESYAITFGR